MSFSNKYELVTGIPKMGYRSTHQVKPRENGDKDCLLGLFNPMMSVTWTQCGMYIAQDMHKNYPYSVVVNMIEFEVLLSEDAIW